MRSLLAKASDRHRARANARGLFHHHEITLFVLSQSQLSQAFGQASMPKLHAHTLSGFSQS